MSVLLIAAVNCCSCEAKCYLMAYPRDSYHLGNVASGAAYQVLEALTLIYGIKYSYKGLWQINLLSYHIFMSQTLLWTWSAMQCFITWIWILEGHNSRYFSMFSHVVQCHIQVAFVITSYLILPKSFIFPHLFAVHTLPGSIMDKYDNQEVQS